MTGVPLGRLDGVHRRMRRGGVRDPELVEPAQQFCLSDRHGRAYIEVGGLRQPPRPRLTLPKMSARVILPGAADHVQASMRRPAGGPRREIAIMGLCYPRALNGRRCAMVRSR
jgi:hypothetical protein